MSLNKSSDEEVDMKKYSKLIKLPGMAAALGVMLFTSTANAALLDTPWSGGGRVQRS